MNFRSKSSYLKLNQQHEGQKGSYQESYSQGMCIFCLLNNLIIRRMLTEKCPFFSTDEPHYLKHTVKKPVYQEVNEVITPYRKIRQEIRPVQEEIETMVARKAYGGGGYGGGYGGGMGGGYGGGGEYY